MRKSQQLGIKRYRQRPEIRERERRRDAARYAATSALVRRHVAEFMDLYNAELRRAGLGGRDG